MTDPKEIAIRIQGSRLADEVTITIPARVWGMEGLADAIKNVIDVTFAGIGDDTRIN